MDELKKLLEKHKEKQIRYDLIKNEDTERNATIILNLEKQIFYTSL